MEEKPCRCRYLVQDIREQCVRKGLGSIKGLGVLFRGLDTDFSNSICFREFVRGLHRYGINIDRKDLDMVFRHFDQNHNGQVDFAEFLLQLRPPMKQCRIDVINEAFDKLDVDKDDILKTVDLKSK